MCLLFSDMGVWTVPLAKHLGSQGSVYSFEAVLENYYALGTNILLNRLTNVDITYGIVGRDTIPMKTVVLDNADGDYVNIGGFSPLLYEQSLNKTHNWSISLMQQPSKHHTEPVSRYTPALTLDSLYEQGKFSCPSFMKVVCVYCCMLMHVLI